MTLSTSELRKAWKNYECAEDKMVSVHFCGDTIRVAPPTVDAWKALGQVFIAHAYAVRKQDTDSYDCRAITGGTGKSLHSYGIALDVNWNTNPYNDHLGSTTVRFSDQPTQDLRAQDVKDGKADTDMTPDLIADVLAIRTNGGMRIFEWGGNWTTKKDTMHFELDLSPADLEEGVDWTSVAGDSSSAADPAVAVKDFLPTASYSDAFLRAHTCIEKWEGGFVDHPSDPGGATNFGITRAVLAAWRGHAVSVQDVKDLTKDEARRIFYARYWQPMRCEDLPWPLALMTYNCGVNSGPGRGMKFLQRSLNQQGAGLAEDGIVGSATLTAAEQANVEKAVKDYAQIYENFYRGLSTWPVFGKGWMNRLSDVTASALGSSAIAPTMIGSGIPADVQKTAFNASSLSQPLMEKSAMPSSQPAPAMTAIDVALGGSYLVGKKTLIAGIAFAVVTVLHQSGLLNLDSIGGDGAYDTIVKLIATYGGLSALSKVERAKSEEASPPTQ